MYWASGDDRRIFTCGRPARVRARRRTGKPIATFGDGGRIDLRRDLDRDPNDAERPSDLAGRHLQRPLIVGGRVSEGLPGIARRHPRLRREDRQAALDLSHDPAARRIRIRDLVEGFLDLQRRRQQLAGHGARRDPRHRLRADRLRVRRFLWRQPARRQPVCEFPRRAECRDRQAALAFPVRAPRHLGSRPAFASEPGTVRRNGEAIDAVAQTTKHGFVFVFDRATGKPLFPIEYRKFPPSDVPGEVTADTQPIPTRPRHFPDSGSRETC